MERALNCGGKTCLPRRQQIENERLEAQRAKEKKKDVNKQKQEQQGTKRCAGNMLENAPFGRSDKC